MSNLSFEYPYVLLLMGLFLLCEKFCKAKVSALIFPHLHLLQQSSIKNHTLQKILKLLAVLFLLVALASPVSKDSIEFEKKDGYAIAILFDASGSMKQRGYAGDGTSKFDVAKKLLQEFVQKRQNDNIGLIVFGDFAYIASPLTYDKQILSSIIETLHLGIAGTKTAIYDALFEASRLFQSAKAKTKVVILLTDGENTAGVTNLDLSLKYLKEENLKVYSIGIGKEGEFDANLLHYISQETKGEAFKAADANALKAVFQKIDEQEKSDIESYKYSKYVYYFQYPLFVSFFLFFAYVYIRNKEGL